MATVTTKDKQDSVGLSSLPSAAEHHNLDPHRISSAANCASPSFSSPDGGLFDMKRPSLIDLFVRANEHGLVGDDRSAPLRGNVNQDPQADQDEIRELLDTVLQRETPHLENSQ